jgi:hypothetical protein
VSLDDGPMNFPTAYLLAGSVILVVSGAEYAFGYAGELRYLARQGMPRNHLIEAADVERPKSFAATLGFYLPTMEAIQGKYVAETIEGGAIVDPNKLIPQPIAGNDSTLTPIAVPMSKLGPFVRFVDAGSRGALFGYDASSKTVLCQPAAVDALTCTPDAAGDGCYAIVHVPRESADPFRLNKDSLQWIPGDPARCPPVKAAPRNCDDRVACCQP